MDLQEKCEHLDDRQHENNIDLTGGSNGRSDMSIKIAGPISDCEENIQKNDEVSSETELKSACELRENSVSTKDDSVESDEETCREKDCDSHELSQKTKPDEMECNIETECDNSLLPECQGISAENKLLPLEHSIKSSLKEKYDNHGNELRLDNVYKNDNENLEEISKELEHLLVENNVQESISEDQSISDSFTLNKETKAAECENSSEQNNPSFGNNILGENAGLCPTNDDVKGTKEINDEKIPSEKENEICGFACFRPKCIQGYARPKVFFTLFSIIGVIHGCYYAYVVSVISTLEKRYSFGSKISGIILLADEIVPLILGVFVGYIGGRMHRPRLVALGMFLSAACCFVSGFPYLIYGSADHLTSINYKNETGPQFCKSEKTDLSCEGVDYPETMTVLGLFLLASLLKGFATLSYYVLGISYLDDIIKKKNTPMYLSTALALRLLGPLAGFLMSSVFLKLYENPIEDPGYGPDDPRWIGAWWIGFFLQGILLFVFTLPIGLFPRRMPGQRLMQNATSPATDDSSKNILLGFLSAIKRLGKNPVFLTLVVNTTVKIFGTFGHSIMLPKYMENQFRLSAADASLFSGATTTFCIMVSTVLGGFLIWKFRPRLKLLLSGMIASEAVLCIGYLILMILRCQTVDMSHFGRNDEGLILNSVCNQNCDCSTTSFTPFCGPEGKSTFFSPCFAGCTQDFTPTTSSTNKKEFGNCSCLVDPIQNRTGASITEGFCPDENCWNQALAYLIILFFLEIVSSLFTVAHTMILLRSVHPSEKSFALGTLESCICLFGFIPVPIIIGALVDSACLVWEKSCGEAGNCWFYDTDKLAYLLHGTAALFCFASVVCLITMYFLSSRVRDLYADEEEVIFRNASHVDIKLDTVSGSGPVTKL